MKRTIAFVCLLSICLCCLISCNKDDAAVDGNCKIGEDGYWYVGDEKTNVLANEYDDPANPQGLEFHLQSDGSYHVAAGEAKLLSKIVVPESYNGKPITGIQHRGFYECRNLVELVIQADITEIEGDAFFGCHSLETMYLPATIKIVSDGAFGNLKLLSTIYFAGDESEWSAFADLVGKENIEKVNVILNSTYYKK